MTSRRARRAGCSLALGVGVAVVVWVVLLVSIYSDDGAPASDPTPDATHAPRATHTHRAHHAKVKVPAGAHGPYGVLRVVDGDTAHVRVGVRDVDVRFIGVDTPEVYGGVQCYGRAASARTRELLDYEDVWLEYDPAQPRRDRYGRTLAYVWLGDGVLVNRNLILHGYGHAETAYGAYRYESSFLHAQSVARAHRRGLWGAC